MKKDPIQLQQRLIYYRAELDKYKKKVQDYQDNYHYSQLEQLKMENAELKEELERWSDQESAVKGELSKRIQGFEEQVNRFEEREESLKKEVQDWQKQCEELKDQKRDLLYKVQDLEGGLGETRRRLSQSQKDMNLLHVSYVQLQKEYQEGKREKAAADKEIGSLRKSLSDTQNEMEEKLEGANQTIAKLQAIHESLRSELNDQKAATSRKEQ
ncbi:hypothetical protein, partial [Halobacillus trueperi]|uniref:hypothetical protein n=1 Tax=Halobacillus trueperi TaxID=156205 RepID=UPI0015F251FD